MPLDPAEPGFAVQQRRGRAALLLVAGPPVIDLTPRGAASLISTRYGTHSAQNTVESGGCQQLFDRPRLPLHGEQRGSEWWLIAADDDAGGRSTHHSGRTLPADPRAAHRTGRPRHGRHATDTRDNAAAPGSMSQKLPHRVIFEYLVGRRPDDPGLPQADARRALAQEAPCPEGPADIPDTGSGFMKRTSSLNYS